MDSSSLQQLNTLHPILRDQAIALWQKIESFFPVNVKPRVTQGLRSFAESDALYAKGRTAHGPKVTNAPAGESYHNYGLAFDFVLIIDGKEVWDVNETWLKVVDMMEVAGWTWGGSWTSFKDYPHFEKTFDHHWKDLLALHNAGKFIPGSTYVQI
jgi:peptidoglycan L-alanyl-D-glutamate endopeptidase CwlK